MKALTKAAAFAGIVVAAVVVERWRRKQLGGVRERPLDDRRVEIAVVPVDAELVEEEIVIVTGEGIDPDAVAAAYEESEAFSDAYEQQRHRR